MSYVQGMYLFLLLKGKPPTIFLSFLICLGILFKNNKKPTVFVFLIYSHIKYNRLFKSSYQKLVLFLIVFLSRQIHTKTATTGLFQSGNSSYHLSQRSDSEKLKF